MFRASTFAGAVALVCLAAAPATAFVPGDVYWAPGDCLAPPCGVFEVAPGDQSGAQPVAVAARAPGQFAFANDIAYLTQFDYDSIVLIDAAGNVATYATGIDGPTGLLLTSRNRLLVVSYYDAKVVYATLGGDLSTATVFAQGFGRPRNLLETSDGRILLADQTRRAVYDITQGGDFTSAAAFASDFPSGPWDLVEGPFGGLYATTGSGIYDFTAGGSLAGAASYASGQPFAGLAIDATGRMLASDFDDGLLWDVTGGGDFSLAAPYAIGLDGYGDTALDTVPPPPVPALGPLQYAVLGLAILLGSGALLGFGPRRPVGSLGSLRSLGLLGLLGS